MRGGLESGGAERGRGNGERPPGSNTQPPSLAPGWAHTRSFFSEVPGTCVARRPADARGPRPGCPDPVPLVRSRPPSAAGPPLLGPGRVGEGHSGTPESRRLCPAQPRLSAPAPAAPSALPAPAVAVPARPSPSRPAQPAAPARDCRAVLPVGGLNHLKQDDCQTHPGRQPGSGVRKGWEV